MSSSDNPSVLASDAPTLACFSQKTRLWGAELLACVPLQSVHSGGYRVSSSKQSKLQCVTRRRWPSRRIAEYCAMAVGAWSMCRCADLPVLGVAVSC